MVGYHFSPKTIEKFREAAITLERARIMAQRIDWLVSGDDGEETFHERWNEDLEKIVIYSAERVLHRKYTDRALLA